MSQIAERTPMQEVVAQVRSDTFKQQIALALPGNVSPERFQRVAVTAIQQTPELITADRGSLFASIVKCAQDGLLPDGREAAFVVFKGRDGKQVQYLPMIGGYRKIAAKHGFTISADVVHENDDFAWTKVPPNLDHTYDPFSPRGEIKGAYAVAFDREGRLVAPPVVMGLEEIAKVRAVSRAADSEYGPWNKWFERMAAKTVARRLFKELPLGDLEEHEARIVEAADDEADLPMAAAGMSTDEANIAAPLTNLAVPVSAPPQDEPPLEGEYEQA